LLALVRLVGPFSFLAVVNSGLSWPHIIRSPPPRVFPREAKEEIAYVLLGKVLDAAA
jgi:hypothetical protein